MSNPAQLKSRFFVLTKLTIASVLLAWASSRTHPRADVHRDEEGRIIHEPPKNPPAPKGILKNRGDGTDLRYTPSPSDRCCHCCHVHAEGDAHDFVRV